MSAILLIVHPSINANFVLSDLKEVISRRTKCNVLINMNVWFTGKGFGVTQKVKQLQIVEKEEMDRPSVFDNSDDYTLK